MSTATETGFSVLSIPEAALAQDGEERQRVRLRSELGVEAFGINAYAAGAVGDVVIEDHDESDLRHQELYFVARGRAEFTLGEETAEAAAGTFVFFADPELRRKAVALDADTAIVAVGAEPGRAFSPSRWETERTASGAS
jgi:hypothetical protein